MKMTNDDHQTVLTYLTARHREAGYKGAVFININRLAEIHLSNSILIANAAVKRMVAK